MYCIYQITNKINGKRYIDQHKYVDETKPMKGYKGSGKLLWKAYNKYGFENFETEVLYKRIRDKSTVDVMEIWAIETYKPEYNLARGGSGGGGYKGHHHSDETKRRMSESHKRYHISEETKIKISKSQKGHLCSEETKRKMSESAKGNKRHKGIYHSEETRRKMSESRKGKKRGPYKNKEISVEMII